MKYFYSFLFCGFLLQNLAQQCPTCTPDLTCVSTNGFPAICPSELPPAVAGEIYTEQLTFYLPAQVTDPGSGTEATLMSVTIASVSGLPYGMSYAINDPDNTYYPAQGENYGCVSICGTPVLPGNYTLTIAVNFVATAFGMQINQSESFTYAMVVLPGSGEVSSFTYNQAAGCGSLDVQFNAVFAGNSSQVTDYTWEFGNGETATVAHPPVVHYASPGDYTASLHTVISNLVLQSVYLGTISSNWSGDVDDFFSSPADPYFVITNGNNNVVYTSPVIDNVNTISWNNLAITLDAFPYTVTFWDDDVITQDDYLGSAMIPMTIGSTNFDAGDGTTGSFSVVSQVINDITDTIIISVFPYPDPMYWADENILSCNDTTLSHYTWMLNGVPIEGENESSIHLAAGGNYSVAVTNQYGCTAVSDPYLFCPAISVFYNGITDELYVAEGDNTYQWYLNGEPIPDANTAHLADPENGSYTVVVTTSYGCIIESEALNLSLGIQKTTMGRGMIYPNPADQKLNIVMEEEDEKWNYSITDFSGKKIVSEQLQPDQRAIDISFLSKGFYVLSLSCRDNNQQHRFCFMKK